MTVPRHPALHAAQASLAELCANSVGFVPPDALEELTAHLLSWAASAVPLKLLDEQLKLAAASDDGAELLLEPAAPTRYSANSSA